MAGLYTSAELLNNYVAGDWNTYTSMWDFKEYQTYVAAGGETTSDAAEAHRQALHDADISLALGGYLGRGKSAAQTLRIVAILGSHSTPRGDASYTMTATVARALTREGYRVATGGGPGAMEAGHVGAYFANSSDEAFERALARLGQNPSLPSLRSLLRSDGTVAPGQEKTLQDASAWLTAALDAQSMADGSPGESLAIPTWKYGSEPTTPLATAYAKFYANSIREESLIQEGKTGAVYALGGGGTLREIFQDMELNFYATEASFVPMIFMDPHGFWNADATFKASGAVDKAGMKLDDVIPKLIRYGFGSRSEAEGAVQSKIQFTTDIATILTTLGRHAPMAQANLSAMLSGGMSSFLVSRI